MKQFSRKTSTQLKNYVYALVDPQSEEIFYVGKGSGAKRPFEHLSINDEQLETRKQKRIQELRDLSIEPRIDILRFGLDNKTAREIEAAVIDSIGLHNLTNKNNGDKSSERGRFTARQIEARLGGQPLDVTEIKEPSILFYRRDAYPESQLYDATRQFWRVSQKRIEEQNKNNELKYQYAFAMRGSFVMEVYKILAWFEAGTTVSSRTYVPSGNMKCWEFVGAIAEPKIRMRYRNKSLMRDKAPLHPTQIGFRYIS